VADYQARQGEHLAEVAKARQKKTDLELRILSLKNNYVQTAADELKDSSNKIADLMERLRPSEDEARRQNIVAPVAGRVVGLQVHTVGAVLAPREPLLDIVPKDSPLLVEAKVGVDSINELHEGMEAEVRLTAYQQRTTPLVKGTVNYVSPDRLVDKEINAPYYTVTIALSAASLKDAGQIRLQPGMGAEVYIQTRARTALDYVLEPVTDSMRRAFREVIDL
jgi:HlyD family type I secretion membrane fusion protein